MIDRRAFLRTTAAALLAARVGVAQEAPLDRKTFLPPNHFPPLPGNSVMLVNTYRIDSAEEHLRFSVDGSSWHQAFVPTANDNSLHNREFLVGPAGEKAVYPRVTWALRWKDSPFAGSYSLMDVEINDGRGTPAGQNAFVVTRSRVVEGTADYPIRPGKLIEGFWTAHQAWIKETWPEIEKGLLKARAAVDGRSYARIIAGSFQGTWLAGPKRLRYRVMTEVEDGSVYQPDGSGFRWGITIGQEFVADVAGKPLSTTTLPLETFKVDVPARPPEPARLQPGFPPLPPPK